MRSYYQLTTPLRPGWCRVTSTALRPGKILGTVGGDLVDPRRWKDPPHVALANLNLTDVKAVRMFTEVYGPLEDDVEAGEQFEVDLEEADYLGGIGGMKERVIDAWRSSDAKRLWVPRGGENSDRYDLPMMWGGRALELRPAGCWTFLRLLATRDIENGDARICRNPKCKELPYFVAGRNNQTFCSHPCANVVMQRNFKKRWRKRRKQ
jgi:hypothetical protein